MFCSSVTTGYLSNSCFALLFSLEELDFVRVSTLPPHDSGSTPPSGLKSDEGKSQPIMMVPCSLPGLTFMWPVTHFWPMRHVGSQLWSSQDRVPCTYKEDKRKAGTLSTAEQYCSHLTIQRGASLWQALKMVEKRKSSLMNTQQSYQVKQS